jgi:hypothetical protein
VKSLRLRLGLSAAMLLSGTLLPSPALAGAANLLPDLQMAPIFGVELKTAKSGHRHLRFGTIVYNVGDGPLEVRGSDARRGSMNRVVQAIKRGDGTWQKVIKSDARIFYTGDGHDHWHIARFNRAVLTALAGNVGEVGALRKIGFCLVDSFTMLNPLTNTPGTSVYGNCGTGGSTRVKMGISVGWGDIYAPETKYQSIDVTGLAAGNYRLCTTTNPSGVWREKAGNHTNNSSWVDVALNAANGDVSVTGSGSTPC